MKKSQFTCFTTFLMLSMLLSGHGLWAQTSLEHYIEEGLKSNIVLQQKHISLERAALSLRIAGSYFQPSVNFSGGYTSGQGGRAIKLPVGDLLNPVYSTLNELTDSQYFPRIENIEKSFLPSNLYDAHVRATLPLINKDLHYNRSMQQDQVELQEFEVKVYERELIKNIKQAYYQYQRAGQVVEIFESALLLVEKNLKVNEALLRNGKGMPVMLLRAQSELEKVKAELMESQGNLNNAQRYFNFLLNRDQEMPITVDMAFEPVHEQIAGYLASGDAGEREEIGMLQTALRIKEKAHRMNQNYWIPQVGGFLDVGAQTENMQRNGKAAYYLLGVTVEFPVFNGLRNRHKVKQSFLDIKEAQLSLQHKAQQLQLAADISRNNLKVSYQRYLASQARLQAAKSYFHLVERGYREGTNSMLEFIDGRTQMTEAQLQETLSAFDVLTSLADYERELAMDPLAH